MHLGPDKKNHLINSSVTSFLDFIKGFFYATFGHFVEEKTGVGKSLVTILR
jgi:hypothetical protein